MVKTTLDEHDDGMPAVLQLRETWRQQVVVDAIVLSVQSLLKEHVRGKEEGDTHVQFAPTMFSVFWSVAELAHPQCSTVVVDPPYVQ